MDDGLSWPAILDNYSIAGTSGSYLCLAKNAQALKAASTYLPLGSASAKVDDPVAVPASATPIFVRINLEPSLLGSIQSALFRLPAMSIETTTESGKVEIYRFTPEMAATGFFLSPIVRNTADLEKLYRKHGTTDANATLSSFRILANGGRRLWKPTYQVTFTQYVR